MDSKFVVSQIEKEFTPATPVPPTQMLGPEPVEEPVPSLTTETLMKVSVDPDIAARLAEEGLAIDQTEVNRILEEANKRQALEEASHDANRTALEIDALPAIAEAVRATGPVGRDEYEELKEGINASFSEIASLLLELQRQIDEIEARLTAHNRRGGHKI